MQCEEHRIVNSAHDVQGGDRCNRGIFGSLPGGHESTTVTPAAAERQGGALVPRHVLHSAARPGHLVDRLGAQSGAVAHPHPRSPPAAPVGVSRQPDLSSRVSLCSVVQGWFECPFALRWWSGQVKSTWWCTRLVAVSATKRQLKNSLAFVSFKLHFYPSHLR